MNKNYTWKLQGMCRASKHNFLCLSAPFLSITTEGERDLGSSQLSSKLLPKVEKKGKG